MVESGAACRGVGLKAGPLGAGAAFVLLALNGAGAGAMPWPP